jgi:hypothetical protein
VSTTTGDDILLGDTARDEVTGFEGLVIGAATYLYAQPQLLLAPRCLKDGVPAEARWFETSRLSSVAQTIRLGFRLLPSVPAEKRARPAKEPQ